ncbi:reverse transcriptase [Brachionus plicatilis]|uniref:Reverse transcriptase n=1 Tax=Brachionus plicatilis TaxID=10195 RepID=A0A3M7Q1M6_BRAPC|nr:reverse transcriptase [Brachionus plicatilis]
MIANIFDFEYRQSISNIYAQVRNAMIKDFVPNYLREKRFSREQWLGQNTEMPFVITTSNGKIIDAYGNHSATDNAASIMEHVLIKDNHLRDALKKCDLAIFDRGFLDCISRLKSAYGLNCKIPTCIKNGQNQLNWSEANETRLVTKSRYVKQLTRIQKYCINTERSGNGECHYHYKGSGFTTGTEPKVSNFNTTELLNYPDIAVDLRNVLVARDCRNYKARGY